MTPDQVTAVSAVLVFLGGVGVGVGLAVSGRFAQHLQRRLSHRRFRRAQQRLVRECEAMKSTVQDGLFAGLAGVRPSLPNKATPSRWDDLQLAFENMGRDLGKTFGRDVDGK